MRERGACEVGKAAALGRCERALLADPSERLSASLLRVSQKGAAKRKKRANVLPATCRRRALQLQAASTLCAAFRAVIAFWRRALATRRQLTIFVHNSRRSFPFLASESRRHHTHTMKVWPLFCCLFAVILWPDGAWARKGKLVRLDEETWSDLLQGEWMVEL